MKSLKIKLNLDYRQKLVLETLANEHRKLYNFLLDKAKNESIIDFSELNELYKDYRLENNLTINSKSAQNTCKSLINNMKSYYALKKKDDSYKFPHRFKGFEFFCTFTLDWNKGNGGFKLNKNVLSISLNSYNNRLYFELPKIFDKDFINEDTIKTVTFKREDENNYFVIFVYSEKQSNLNLNEQKFISIDLGINQIATCFSNIIDPLSIENSKFNNVERRIEKLQSLRDQKKKKSNKYIKMNKKFKKIKRKLTNKRKDFQHKVSTKIIDICKENDIGKLIVGDIETKKLVHNYMHGLNKSTQNSGALSRFKSFLEYKSKSANIDFHKVNEAYTSQMNCLTGKREFNSDLSIRKVTICENIVIDRDLNSAINIAKRDKAIWLSQINDWLSNKLANHQKMYVDCYSNLHMSKIY